ncbi:MAG: AMP-binding protein [Microthrixaceae bacterium]
MKATTNAYGLTESSSVATTSRRVRTPEGRLGGVPMPVVDIAIADPTGAHLGLGETGEVLIQARSSWPDTGTTRRPRPTRSDTAGCTPRRGPRDSDGFLYITDRADMLIRGGENVYCVEIENRLRNIPRSRMQPWWRAAPRAG